MPTMKPASQQQVGSTIYREAARLIERGEAEYSCTTVDLLEGTIETAPNGGPLTAAYMRLMFGWERWPIDASVDFERDDRVIALCFMAAIAEDEERSARRSIRARKKTKAEAK